LVRAENSYGSGLVFLKRAPRTRRGEEHSGKQSLKYQVSWKKASLLKTGLFYAQAQINKPEAG